MWAALGLALFGLAMVAQVWQGFVLDTLGVVAALGAAVASRSTCSWARRASSTAIRSRSSVSRFLRLDPSSGRWYSRGESFPFEDLGDTSLLGNLADVTVPVWSLCLWLVLPSARSSPLCSRWLRSSPARRHRGCDRDGRAGRGLDRRLVLARRDACRLAAPRRRDRPRRDRARRDVATTIQMMVRRVLLASPRGYCAGVERAVETVERALDHYGAPVYVRKQIVHNIHVVRDLESRGAIFVDQETEVPAGRDGRLLGARRRTARACELAATRTRRDRCHLSARDQGARAGPPLRRRRVHRHPDRPRGPRGSRGHHGRGARVDDPRRVGRRRRGAGLSGRTRNSPTSPRRHSRSTRRAR